MRVLAFVLLILSIAGLLRACLRVFTSRQRSSVHWLRALSPVSHRWLNEQVRDPTGEHRSR